LFYAIFLGIFLSSLFPLEAQQQDKRKALILVISSDNEKVYRSHKTSWRRYMHAFSEDFESYFIEFDPQLTTPYKVEGDVLKIQGEESYIPGIFDKTLLALKYFEDRFDAFDFVIRPNLSSFLVLSRLKNYLSKQKKENFYAGHPLFYQDYEAIRGNHLLYASGACPIFSIDMAKHLIKTGENLMGKPYGVCYADDLLLGKVCKEKGVGLTPFYSFYFERFVSPYKVLGSISQETFHFRIKLNQETRHIFERTIHRELYEIFYYQS